MYRDSAFVFVEDKGFSLIKHSNSILIAKYNNDNRKPSEEKYGKAVQLEIDF